MCETSPNLIMNGAPVVVFYAAGSPEHLSKSEMAVLMRIVIASQDSKSRPCYRTTAAFVAD
jgi:hypothetical protein